MVPESFANMPVYEPNRCCVVIQPQRCILVANPVKRKMVCKLVLLQNFEQDFLLHTLISPMIYSSACVLWRNGARKSPFRHVTAGRRTTSSFSRHFLID